MNYNELKNTCHNAAVKGGWYEQEKIVNELLCLILSEHYECMDAYRSRNWCNLSKDQLKDLRSEFNHNLESFAYQFKTNVKDTVQDELADVVIRTLDMAGYFGIEIPKVKFFEPTTDILKSTWEFTGICWSMSNKVLNCYHIAILLGYVEGTAREYEIDLETHVMLKLAYNSTRGLRHGGKIA